MKFSKHLSEINNYLQVNIKISQLHLLTLPTNLSSIAFALQHLSNINIHRQQLNLAS